MLFKYIIQSLSHDTQIIYIGRDVQKLWVFFFQKMNPFFQLPFFGSLNT